MKRKMWCLLALLLFICGCEENGIHNQSENEKSIEKSTNPLSFPVSRIDNGFRVNFGNGFNFTFQKHFGPLYYCIKRTEEHINIRLNREGGAEIFNFHYGWWRGKAGKFCIGTYVTGNLVDRFYANPPCKKTCNESSSQSKKKVRTFAKNTLAVMFVVGSVALVDLMFQGIEILTFGLILADVPGEMYTSDGASFVLEISGEVVLPPPVECVRDVDPSEPLPQNLRPELVVLTRRWGLHVIGHDANLYGFCQWYADPNPANLPAIWASGTWDGTSMYFEEPYGYNKFTPAKQQGRDFLPAGDPNTRVSEGVQVVNNGFSYTCNQRTSNAQELSDQDYLPVVQPPDNQGLYLERSDSQIVMENGARWPYILWWAVPNPNNLTSVWLQGSFDGNDTYFDIPQGRNHFVIAETNINPRPEQFYPVGSNQAQLGAGISISGTDFLIDLY